MQIVGGLGWVVPDQAMFEEYERQARARLDECLASLAAELGGVEIEPSTVHGAPARVLLQAAEGATALVVGSRGHGGFVGLLLGSVSQQCSHHAPCPVVVVPPAR